MSKSDQPTQNISISPNGESFVLPSEADLHEENKRLADLAAAHRADGREIVVVMGVGFVGSVMAGVVADEVVAKTGGPTAVIDCFGILTDDQIRRYFELGCEVKGLGLGHIQRIKEQVRQSKE